VAAQRLVRDGRRAGANIKVGSHTSIIQCPSCQTKFAVRTAQIEEVKNPRFHCSRCDHLFSLEEVLVTSTPAPLRKAAPFRPAGFSPTPSAPAETKAQAPEPDFPQYSQPELPESRADEEDLEQEEEELIDSGELGETGYDEEPVDEEQDLPAPEQEKEYNFEDDTEGRKIEEEDRTFEPWRFEAPPPETPTPQKLPKHEKEQIAFPFEESDDEVPFLSGDEDDEEEEYIGSPISWMDKVLPLQEKSRPAAKEQSQDEDDWLSGLKGRRKEPEAQPQEGPRILRKGSEYVEVTPPPNIQAKHEDPEVARRPTERRPLFREVSSSPGNYKAPVQTTLSDAPVVETSMKRWKTVLVLLVPLVLGLIGLGILSIRTLSDPTIAQGVLSRTLPIGPAIPPPGLFISDVQFKQLSLGNDSAVPALTGKVVNKSDMTFKEVVIIGGLFDKTGAALVEAKSNLSSPLHKSRIKSLSADMLQKLMTSGNSSAFKLKPGEEASFILPFTDTTTGGNKLTKTPAHFAAKVFSASE